MKVVFRFSVIALAAFYGTRVSPAQNTLTVSPSPVVFCDRPGQPISTVPVGISSSTGPLTFLVTGVISDGNWLVVDPSFATATSSLADRLVIGVQGGLIPFVTGTYNGQILLGTLDGARLASIPVSLQVSATGCTGKSRELFSDLGPLTFQMPPNVSSGEVASIYNTFPTNVTSVPYDITDNGQAWLSTVRSDLTFVTGLSFPTPLGIGVITNGLAAGTYTGHVDLSASNFSSLSIPVTLIVDPSASSAQLAASPSPLSIGIPLGSNSTSANIQLTNIGTTAIPVSISSAADRNWLVVSPSSALISPNSSQTLTATFIGPNLVPDLNQGSIKVQVTSGAGASFTIPVTAKYDIRSKLAATPNPLSFNLPVGTVTPVSEILTVSTTYRSLSFSSSVLSSVNQPWLSVSPYNATVSPGISGKMTVSVQPALLPVGPAIGVITLTPSDGSSPLTIPVSVNAGTDSSLSVIPSQVSFVSQPGTAVLQTQALNLMSSVAGSYSVQVSTSSGRDWLQATPSTLITSGGTIPSTVTVQANAGGLAPGSYDGRVVITNTSSGAQQTIPVNLTVGQPVSLAASPQMLAFTYEAGASTVPQAQPVQVTGTGSALFSATATSFLTVTPSTASSPAVVMAGLIPVAVANLPVGQYSEAVTITAAGATQVVTVSLAVVAPVPRITALVNSASLAPGPVAPGEFVTLYGSGFGPSAMVTFDSFSAPVMYAGPGQINAIVPYEIAGQVATNVSVASGGGISVTLPLRVASTAPAIFSATQTGNGQGTILNGDGSFNSVDHPAARGSVIQIFGTGEGVYAGAQTGSVTATLPPFPVLAAPVNVTIGGEPAQVQYAGEAPGLTSGLFQVNATVPAKAGPGLQPVVVRFGDGSNAAQSIVVAVQ